jgi:hypothetical protein
VIRPDRGRGLLDIAAIHDATPIGQYDLGPYQAILLGEIEAEPEITYLWALQIARVDELDIRLLVTAEMSEQTDSVMRELGIARPDDEASQFLCSFTPDGSHNNYGRGGDWSDPGIFLAAALRVAADELDVNDEPVWVRGHRASL